MSDKCKNCESYSTYTPIGIYTYKGKNAYLPGLECNGRATADHKPCFIPKKKGKK